MREIPIILGRPFLTTAVIDVKNGRLTFKVKEGEVEFNLLDYVKHPSFTDGVFQVDVVRELTEEVSRVSNLVESLENCLLYVGTSTNQVLKVAAVASALDAADPLPRYRSNMFRS